MGTLIGAGVPVAKSLRQRHHGSLAKIASEMASSIERGEGCLSEQMEKYPGIFSRLECQLMNVGEKTGSIDGICRRLAESFKFQGRMKNKIIAGLAYPVLLFHFAGVIMPFFSFIIGASTLPGMILSIILFLSPFYLFLVVYLLLQHSKKILRVELPEALGASILYIPLIGPLIRKLDYARFFGCYGTTLGAGIHTGTAIQISAETCSNSWIKESFLKCAREVENNNCTFHEAFTKYVFPPDRESIALSLMETGEVSGSPDDSARHIAEIYQAEAEQALGIIADMAPKIIYFAIVIYLGFKIIGSWQYLFSKTTALGE